MGKERVEAQTDGGLFIAFLTPWPRRHLENVLCGHVPITSSHWRYLCPFLLCFLASCAFGIQLIVRQNARSAGRGKTDPLKRLRLWIPKIRYLQPKYLQKCSEWSIIPSTFVMKIKRQPTHLVSVSNVCVQAFAMFIFHTSFQLYHCKVPRHYLKDIYDTGFSNTNVNLQCTPMYDFCDPEKRGQWCDIFVAVVEYLRIGESKVQWLSKSHPKNLIHRVSIHFVRNLADIRIGTDSMRPRFWKMWIWWVKFQRLGSRNCQWRRRCGKANWTSVRGRRIRGLGRKQRTRRHRMSNCGASDGLQSAILL